MKKQLVLLKFKINFLNGRGTVYRKKVTPSWQLLSIQFSCIALGKTQLSVSDLSTRKVELIIKREYNVFACVSCTLIHAYASDTSSRLSHVHNERANCKSYIDIETISSYTERKYLARVRELVSNAFRTLSRLDCRARVWLFSTLLVPDIESERNGERKREETGAFSLACIQAGASGDRLYAGQELSIRSRGPPKRGAASRMWK